MNDEQKKKQREDNSNEEKVAHLAQLQTNVGWQIVKKEVQGYVDGLQEQLYSGAKDETIEDVRVARKKLQAYEELLRMPEYLMEVLTKTEASEIKDDPYPER